VFEAAIGSGVAHSIKEWLEACFGLVDRRWEDHVRIQTGFKAEYPCLVSDPTTIRSLGWSPEVSMVQLAELMVAAR
jgi:GDP-D-mannose dehydratase